MLASGSGDRQIAINRLGGQTSLVHDARLAVAVGVGLWVELVLHGGGSAGGGGVGGGVTGSGARDGTADGAGLAGKAVVTLLAASKGSALLLEVGHGDGGEGGGGVVLGGVVVNLVDGDGGVDNSGLDGFCS